MMAKAAADIHPALTAEKQAAYFAAREEEQRELGELILERLREEQRNPLEPPRRTLVEIAVETGSPIQLVQQALWTLETRGQIRWEQGRFVLAETGADS
jgi:hypothetical protein